MPGQGAHSNILLDEVVWLLTEEGASLTNPIKIGSVGSKSCLDVMLSLWISLEITEDIESNYEVSISLILLYYSILLIQ